MLFLYHLPNWLLGLCVVVTLLVLYYASYFAVRRLWPQSIPDEQINVALAVLSVLATISSLLLAFSAVSVWESFGSAEESVVQEANTVGALSRSLAVYDSAESVESRRLLRQYVEMVVKVEWPEMQGGRASTEVWTTFDLMFAAIGTMEPDNPRRVALLPEIWARTNELLRQRRSRLFTSESQIPGTLLAVAVIGTVLTLVITFVFPPTRFHLSMAGLLVTSLSLVFWLIFAMDRPFAGQESISVAPFEAAIQNMDRWDARVSGSRVR